MRKLIKTTLILIGAFHFVGQCQCSAVSAIPNAAKQLEIIQSRGWQECAPFTVEIYKNSIQKENWPFWIDALCSLMQQHKSSMSIEQMLHRQVLENICINFAIATGLLSHDIYATYEIKSSSQGAPCFVGCKDSIKIGVNPALRPYADWHLLNLPFVSKTTNIVNEIYNFGSFAYSFHSQRDTHPLFLYPANSSGTQILEKGYCNIPLIKKALLDLKQKGAITRLKEAPCVKLINGLIEECNKQLINNSKQ